MMKLLRFRVTSFRSVEDSGWIDVDGVTALIGTNESGKTNVLVPLWKLRPAKARLLRGNAVQEGEERYVEMWRKLFEQLTSAGTPS